MGLRLVQRFQEQRGERRSSDLDTFVFRLGGQASIVHGATFVRRVCGLNSSGRARCQRFRVSVAWLSCWASSLRNAAAVLEGCSSVTQRARLSVRSMP